MKGAAHRMARKPRFGRWFATMLAALLALPAAAQQVPLRFENPELEARFNVLTEELRCLVCQNQNLADSDAPLAHDLRQEIYEMLQAGRSDAEIKTFLVDRYGDFVLYRPPVKGNTLALWLAPAVLLLIGAVTIVIAVRRRARLPVDDIADPPPDPASVHGADPTCDHGAGPGAGPGSGSGAGPGPGTRTGTSGKRD